MKKLYITMWISLLCALAGVVQRANAQVVSQQALANKELGWHTVVQGNGTAMVTSTNPRYGFGDVGEGSLQLRSTGDMNDWVFAYRYADTNYGMLSQLTSLSFDWFRVSSQDWNAEQVNGINLYDWKYKSPAFRVFFSDNTEIVWESYFNRPINNDVSYIDTWQTSQLLNGNFWYRNGSGYSLNTSPCFTNQLPIWGGNVAAITISDIVNCYGDKTIIGVGVGLGSQWPYQYEGFIDNVKVSSNNVQVLNTNFDNSKTIPEPTTPDLMIIGAFVLGGVILRKKLI